VQNEEKASIDTRCTNMYIEEQAEVLTKLCAEYGNPTIFLLIDGEKPAPMTSSLPLQTSQYYPSDRSCYCC
jgi:hypothetical protein